MWSSLDGACVAVSCGVPRPGEFSVCWRVGGSLGVVCFALSYGVGLEPLACGELSYCMSCMFCSILLCGPGAFSVCVWSSVGVCLAVHCYLGQEPSVHV